MENINKIHAAVAASASKVSNHLSPYCIEVNDGSIRVLNSLGEYISERIETGALSDDMLCRIAHSRDAVVRDEAGSITRVHLYIRPVETQTPGYQFRMRLLGNLNLKTI